MKTCNFDCIYCELGKTQDKTTGRVFDVSAEEVLSELDAFFKSHEVPIDILTITGYGEPTLNKNFPDIARSIKDKYPNYRLALLTNSSYLEYTDDVYDCFDVIIPSLNAIGDDTFNKVNKPEAGFMSSHIIKNLKMLRMNFKGSLEIAILFCRGINDGIDEIVSLLETVRMINPDKVWINTVVRHPAYDTALPITDETTIILTRIFNSHDDFDRDKIIRLLNERY
jgi:wyosine [tRNA(Phe)-imidazoG37] synthetase (radical SAM superfamily)